MNSETVLSSSGRPDSTGISALSSHTSEPIDERAALRSLELLSEMKKHLRVSEKD